MSGIIIAGIISIAVLLIAVIVLVIMLLVRPRSDMSPMLGKFEGDLERVTQESSRIEG
ncbi:MAG: hypothetical protein AABZ39_07120 [Spirochaetota bacterium]